MRKKERKKGRKKWFKLKLYIMRKSIHIYIYIYINPAKRNLSVNLIWLIGCWVSELNSYIHSFAYSHIPFISHSYFRIIYLSSSLFSLLSSQKLITHKKKERITIVMVMSGNVLIVLEGVRRSLNRIARSGEMARRDQVLISV